jgi:hypothetical protein
MEVRRCVIVALCCIASACASEEPAGPLPGPGPGTDVNTYLQSLPPWAQFSPALADQDPAPTGPGSLVFDTVPQVRTVRPNDTTVAVANNVEFVCEVTPYSVQRNPQEIVMYSPNAAILFPGALIQGATHRDGAGSLLPLIINERAPINVSIPAVQTGANFRRVDTVDQAHVASAIGSIIGNATATGLQTSSSIFFHQETYNSQRQFGLSANLSGRYLGFEGAAGGSINRNSSETTISAHFYQKMFTVVVSPPATPGGWFTSAFTNAQLQQQVGLNRIGPSNLPVYIGEIVYGRMMMFSITSTASETELRTMVNASYQNLTGQISGGLSTRDKKILSESRISIASIGGNDSATIAMIRTGDWAAYFTSSAPLSTAEPLSYSFYNVGDNSLASVTEATSYNVRACSPAGAGQFDLLPAQSFGAPVPTPFETRVGDVNGDGRSDLIFNHRLANTNQVAVALGQATGQFAAPGAAVSHPTIPVESWAVHQLFDGDFNGDGRTDLYWSLRDSVNNIYVALADGAGGWTFQPRQQQVKRSWAGYNAFVGDLDNDGDDDLLWNRINAGPNWVYTALSNGDGTFALDTTLQVIWTSGSTAYHTHLVDVTRDGRADLIWNLNSGQSVNRTYTALGLGNGRFGAWAGPYDHPTACCWGGYQSPVADVSGDQTPDMLWYVSTGTVSYLHRATGSGTGSVTFRTGQDLGASTRGGFTALTGDVDGNGTADLILNRLTTTTNVIAVARGTAPIGAVNAGVTPNQTHSVATNWNAALAPLVGDVNDDGRADVVWVIPGAPTRVFVARSRAS